MNLPDSTTGPLPANGSEPAILQDVTKAAQLLTRLTLESAAQAVMIVRQGQLWAYAGQLSQPTVEELTSKVAQYKLEGDLVRFIRLQATQAEHLLYATSIAEGVALALVFDAETPFSTIRSQVKLLVQSLSITTPDANGISDSGGHDGTDFYKSPVAEIPGDIPPIDSVIDDRMGVASSSVALRSDSDQQRMDLADQGPLAKMRPSDSIPGTPVQNRESIMGIPIKEFVQTEQPQNIYKESITSTTAPQELGAAIPLKLHEPQAPAGLDEAFPPTVSERTGRIILEPVSPALYYLPYACLLIPRFPKHYLTGDLATHLSAWLPQICIAYSWRLEYLSVRPEYLQWVANAPPNISPENLIRLTRRQTSERIFENLPQMKHENPSGDFWAPGYLIMAGPQPQPARLVQDYIKRTRQHQGISNPNY
jgi:REP element-mobilizing transposase RayT